MTQYGLLGHPLGHSFSRKFHNERFASLGIDAEYLNFDLADISTLPQVIAEHPELSGLNVTIPYKQEVMQFLDELDPLAERIGAVNTIVIRRSQGDAEVSGKIPGCWLRGYNTDIIGFTDSITPLLQQAGLLDAHRQAITQDGQQPRALILGTGGASRAVKVALEDMGIVPVYVSRHAGQDRLTYADLDTHIMQTHQVIVNCSPVGMFPHVDECPDIPYHLLTSGHVCYDLIYNPAETLFLSRSKAQGAHVMSGGAMLEGQAIASYDYWTR